MGIGLLAGALSTIGFCKQDFIITGKTDTCGINNLHGMPGLLGGIASAMVPMYIEGTGVVMKNQLIGVVGTFVIALVTGALPASSSGLLAPRRSRTPTRRSGTAPTTS